MLESRAIAKGSMNRFWSSDLTIVSGVNATLPLSLYMDLCEGKKVKVLYEGKQVKVYKLLRSQWG